MKTGKFTPHPGDLFLWYFEIDDHVVGRYEKIYSSSMNTWVLCVGTNLLIALTNTDMWWMNNKRFMHIKIDDGALIASRPMSTAPGRDIYPVRSIS